MQVVLRQEGGLTAVGYESVGINTWPMVSRRCDYEQLNVPLIKFDHILRTAKIGLH